MKKYLIFCLVIFTAVLLTGCGVNKQLEPFVNVDKKFQYFGECEFSNKCILLTNDKYIFIKESGWGKKGVIYDNKTLTKIDTIEYKDVSQGVYNVPKYGNFYKYNASKRSVIKILPGVLSNNATLTLSNMIDVEIPYPDDEVIGVYGATMIDKDNILVMLAYGDRRINQRFGLSIYNIPNKNHKKIHFNKMPYRSYIIGSFGLVYLDNKYYIGMYQWKTKWNIEQGALLSFDENGKYLGMIYKDGKHGDKLYNYNTIVKYKDTLLLQNNILNPNTGEIKKLPNSDHYKGVSGDKLIFSPDSKKYFILND